MVPKNPLLLGPKTSNRFRISKTKITSVKEQMSNKEPPHHQTATPHTTTPHHTTATPPHNNEERINHLWVVRWCALVMRPPSWRKYRETVVSRHVAPQTHRAQRKPLPFPQWRKCQQTVVSRYRYMLHRRHNHTKKTTSFASVKEMSADSRVDMLHRRHTRAKNDFLFIDEGNVRTKTTSLSSVKEMSTGSSISAPVAP
jgi:hypothetical protein